jgi:GTP pyrophosphokinase
MQISEKFREALVYAAELHAAQFRKGSGAPYIAHLLGVTAIVLEYGGNEDEAIAALLHDAVEDQGGQPTLAAIQQRFGSRVAQIVEACTDADTVPKPPWQERKEKYLAHLAAADAGVCLVSTADKLYNLRTIVEDYRALGEDIWPRFTAGKSGTLWYYREVTRVMRQAWDCPLVDELSRTLEQLEQLVGPI